MPSSPFCPAPGCPPSPLGRVCGFIMRVRVSLAWISFVLDAVHSIFFKVCFWTRHQEITCSFISHLIAPCRHDPLPGGSTSFFFASQTVVSAAREDLVTESVTGLWERVMRPFLPCDEISVQLLEEAGWRDRRHRQGLSFRKHTAWEDGMSEMKLGVAIPRDAGSLLCTKRILCGTLALLDTF